MHIMITGGHGFIGCHVAAKLATNPVIKRITLVVPKLLTGDNYTYEELNLRMDRVQHIASHDTSGERDRIARHRCDLRDAQDCRRLFANIPDVDVIVHLAGITGARPQPHEWSKYMDNVSMVQNLLQNKPKSCTNFISTSSSSVYNTNTTKPFHESDVVAPRGMYAISKRIGEQLVELAAAGDINTTYTILRPFTVFGPLGRPDMLIPRLVDSVTTGECVNIDHQGMQFRDFTPVHIVASTIENLIMKPIDWALSPLTLNVAYGEYHTVKHMIDTITVCVGKQPTINITGISTSYIDNSHASVSKLINHAGPVDRPNITDAIREMVNYNQVTRNPDIQPVE